jgi:hypothetical protein
MWFFLLPSLPKITNPTKGTATRTDVAFYFMPGAEKWLYTKVGCSGTPLK